MYRRATSATVVCSSHYNAHQFHATASKKNINKAQQLPTIRRVAATYHRATHLYARPIFYEPTLATFFIGCCIKNKLLLQATDKNCIQMWHIKRPSGQLATFGCSCTTSGCCFGCRRCCCCYCKRLIELENGNGSSAHVAATATATVVTLVAVRVVGCPCRMLTFCLPGACCGHYRHFNCL